VNPPDNALGGVVPLDLLLARTDAVAVVVSELTAYASGFSFELAVTWRRPPSGWEEARRRQALWHARAGVPSDDTFLLEVELAEGGRAALLPQGGGGDDSHWQQRLWASPLPPPGPLALVCEWPAEGIALTRHPLDEALVRAAAGRAQLLWGEREGRVTGGGVGMYRLFAFGEREDDESA
jgi:hypothetical protein